MESEATPPPMAQPAIANGGVEESLEARGEVPDASEATPSEADVVAKLNEYLADSSMSMNLTERQLRERLEGHFGTPLKRQKTVIRSQVLNWLAAKQEKEAEAEKDQAGSSDKPPAKRKRGTTQRPSLLSEPMQKFLGVERMPRTQVVKCIWDYIKSNNLQKPEDKRSIFLDDKLVTLFKNPLTMFSMNKQLNKHLFTDDTEEAPPSRKKKSAADDGKPKQSALMRPCKLSPELQELFGEPLMTRQQLSKSFYDYLKEHNLLDPSNKRYVLSDAKLKALTGEDRFLAFGHAKYFKSHLSPGGEDTAEKGESRESAAVAAARGDRDSEVPSSSARDESDGEEELSD